MKRLLAAATAGKTRDGVPGPERRVMYRLALETGLWLNEICSLTRDSFDLTPAALTVTVKAAYSKRRREDTLPLRPALAAELRDHFVRMPPGAAAFKTPKDLTTMSRVFQADVAAAGIAYRDDAGRV